MDAQEIEIRLVPHLSDIGQEDWDACACPEVGGRRAGRLILSPPIGFLSALEESGSVGPGTGWQQQHLVALVGRASNRGRAALCQDALSG